MQVRVSRQHLLFCFALACTIFLSTSSLGFGTFRCQEVKNSQHSNFMPHASFRHWVIVFYSFLSLPPFLLRALCIFLKTYWNLIKPSLTLVFHSNWQTRAGAAPLSCKAAFSHSFLLLLRSLAQSALAANQKRSVRSKTDQRKHAQTCPLVHYFTLSLSFSFYILFLLYSYIVFFSLMLKMASSQL